MQTSTSIRCLLIGASLSLTVGCVKRAAPEPTDEQKQAAAQAEKEGDEVQVDPKKAKQKKLAAESKSAKQKTATKREVGAKPTASVAAAAGDPHGGKFSLEEATVGLPAKGKLVADIETELGKLSCELYDDKAPITVANFVGLARGLRAWKDKGEWVKKPLYDGTAFHRVIKGFMIQGGDPAGNGSGGPGYVIPDEVWAGAHHDERGQLCMANRGPNTNGSQFFIMDGKAAHLDGGYTIFGKCSPESVIDKLSGVEVQRDRAVKPTKITAVKVTRK
jgi:peptidyl-prolyl cis-trans isomerase A (cyclophilin A)